MFHKSTCQFYWTFTVQNYRSLSNSRKKKKKNHCILRLFCKITEIKLLLIPCSLLCALLSQLHFPCKKISITSPNILQLNFLFNYWTEHWRCEYFCISVENTLSKTSQDCSFFVFFFFFIMVLYCLLCMDWITLGFAKYLHLSLHLVMSLHFNRFFFSFTP